MINENPVWRLKYLPKNLDEVAGRDYIKLRLKEIIKKRNFPHLLLVGSEGVGKSTIAKLFAKEFLGRFFDANFKFVYADEPLTSEERKEARSEAYVSTSKIGSMAGKRITTPAFLQVKIKPFVQLKVLGDVPFKILVVKNFEVLESDQQGFRRLMEIYGSNCRMILITTKISGIIDPILSRCQLFLIPQINYKNFEKLFATISKKESLTLGKGVLEYLYKISNGCISKAIDFLQLCASTGSKIDLNKIYNTLKEFEKDTMKNLFLNVFNNDFSEIREEFRKIISDSKYNAQELFIQLLNEVKLMPISTYAKIKLINLIADADFRTIDGRDDDIQISALMTKLSCFKEYL